MNRSLLILGVLNVGVLLPLGTSALLVGTGNDADAAQPTNSRAKATKSSATDVGGSESPKFTADHDGLQRLIVPFLNRHCLSCHGPAVQEADFRVDEHLPNEFLTRSVAEKWSEVLNRLNRGDMPPRGEPRPPVEEIAKVVDWISHERLRGEKSRKGTTIVLRRLNRAEYNNTIRELTGVDMQPTDEFPADPPGGGFDNNGGVLTISPLHLELYVKAAQRVLDRAIVTEKERPVSIKWRLELEEEGHGSLAAQFNKQVRGQDMYAMKCSNPPRNGMTVLNHEPMWGPMNERYFSQIWGFEFPRAGDYVIRIRAAGVVPPEETVRRAGPQIHSRRANSESNTLALVQKHFAEDRRYRFGPPRLRLLGNLGNDRVLGEFDIDAPESNPKVYELRAWMEPGTSGLLMRNVYHIPGHSWNGSIHDDAFPRPELLIDWLELEGPIYDSWPPSSHQHILFDSPNQSRDEEAYAREVLARFMRRAYRRPLRDGEVESKVALFRKVRPNRASFEEAIQIPLVAVLSSPHFLYLVEDSTEPENTTPRRLNDFEIAARLSYFLWSNMPDDELARLSEQRRLANPQALVAQADRMLTDSRVEQFAKNFAGQWLKLREVGANPPAKNIYPDYDDHLQVSIRGESEAFFSHILRNDLSVLNFIRSDFVTINERLARFYDIRGVKGDHFRAVKVPAGVPRGGLLTQASMLTVTSNGTRTSPVWRGVWILERLLGDPPPPPPPNAGDIPPAAPGQQNATVRDRLRSHREQKQCARCHNKIDPLGFALENFNAAGDWREREPRYQTSEYGPNDPLIDASAQLPDGTEFVGVEGLQNELLKRQDQFLRCLSEKLYGYALGRELGYADQPTIDSAVKHMKQNRNTLRSLIHHIVSSEAFRTK